MHSSRRPAEELLLTPVPTPPHQVVLGRLHFALASYLQTRPDLTALFSPAEITWDEEQPVQPDLFVIPVRELSASWKTVRALLLALEVVVPASAEADRWFKRRLYQRQGVETYWVVDPDSEVVEVWRPGDGNRPEIVTGTLRWRVAPAARELVVDLGELFGDLPRE